MTKIISIAIVFYLPVVMGSTSIPGWFARLVVDLIKKLYYFRLLTVALAISVYLEEARAIYPQMQ